MLISCPIWRQELHPALCQVGKLPGQSLAATNVTGLQPIRLFYVTDTSTGLRFLVDTGAQVSVVPPSPADRKCPQSGLTLQAVPIRTYGTRSLTLNLDLHCTFHWVFVIAKTTTPILGADFLQHFQLLVDLRYNLLTATATNLVVKGSYPARHPPARHCFLGAPWTQS